MNNFLSLQFDLMHATIIYLPYGKYDLYLYIYISLCKRVSADRCQNACVSGSHFVSLRPVSAFRASRNVYFSRVLYLTSAAFSRKSGFLIVVRFFNTFIPELTRAGFFVRTIISYFYYKKKRNYKTIMQH